MHDRAYKHYLLGILTVILVFNLVDRVALGVLLEDIKADLDLTDTQLGFLSGIAFALFYSVMGVPIARWADRGNRVAIISVTALLWSVAVALCGLAASFTQLVLIRIAVAVGEAGCVPPAYSLMADYFDRAERARATAIYGFGGPLACLIGFFFAGWLNELYGWRMTFMLLGAPGLVLAALAWFTLREPRRAQRALSPTSLAEPPPPPVQPSLKEVCATLSASATFRYLLLCLAVLFFFDYGIFTWLPVLFIRSFGFTTGEIGTWLALSIGIGGIAGSWLGGALASRAAHNERLQLKRMALLVGASGMLAMGAYCSSNPYLAFGLTGLFTAGLMTVNGPLFATVQTLIPERMRAMSFALMYLFANFIGMGLGPLAAGALSDAFRSWAGDESIRYALLALSPGFFLSGWCAWLASQTVARDITTAQLAHGGGTRGEGDMVNASS